AEDGIRDRNVTGVQTCALPISTPCFDKIKENTGIFSLKYLKRCLMSVLSYFVNGISLGSVYAIIALGYTMVYGIAKMLNFAHGRSEERRVGKECRSRSCGARER